ncbi:MAG: DUF2064 domain-containing protein [Bacteroidetes bacterium]|nr:DUF2064 domain-containing protein [Bacteroidota bacterium]MCH8326098.1 DUF2064 domain-containing protein [Bacteroidota bacterium]
MNSQTAILLFSRDPLEDSEIKSTKKLRQLSNSCFEKSLFLIYKIISNSNLDYFVSTTKGKGEEYFSKYGCPLIIQPDKTFGEKFYESIKKVFNNGYDNIVVIGNDTPSLKLNDITFAAKHTSKNNSVIGPSKDGGFYLFSINKDDFKKIDSFKFISINYQQPNAFFELISLLNDCSIFQYLLKQKNDFDKIYSIKVYVLFKYRIEQTISISQNVIFNNLYIKYFLTLFIKYKNSFYTFVSLSSPPVLV